MINDLFGVIALIFPILTLIAVVAALVFLARAWSRMSSGSVGAGPPLVATPADVGLQRVPWELQGMADAIRSNSTQPVDLLLRRAEALGVPVEVHTGISVPATVESILDQLERALGLPALNDVVVPTPPPPNHESLPS